MAWFSFSSAALASLRTRVCQTIFAVALTALPTVLQAGGPLFQVRKAVYATDLSSAAPTNQPMVLSGMSATGSMAGYYIDHTAKVQGQATVYPHAFVWNDAAGTVTDLNNVLGASASIATCMNRNGVVAGVAWISSGDFSNQYGFVWQNGTVTTFQSPDGSSIDAVVAVNDSGQATATYYASGSNYKRAFIWDGNNSTDLGDFGDSQNSFVWPTSINNAGQVVGTLYEESGIAGPQPSTAFLWANGTMSELDSEEVFGNTVAAGINNSGQTASSYVYTDSRKHTTLSGGFYADASTEQDLGNLGKGQTAPFLINDAGRVFGTSSAADTTTHLFGWQAGTMTDMGAVTLATGTSAFGLTGINSAGNATGFVLDGNSAPHAVWRSVNAAGDLLHDIASMLPGSVGYVADNTPGTSVLVNEMGRVACSGYSQGKPVVLLLLPDTDGDGMPDEWETAHGLNPLDPSDASADPDGDGLTNLQEYQQGTDPHDYYNGVTPSIQIAGGNNQSSAPGNVLPQALTVLVLKTANGAPAANAPVTFQITAGASQLAASGSGIWGFTRTVRSDASGHALVYCQLPTTAANNAAYSIQVSAGTAAPVFFNETAVVVPTATAAGLYHTLALDPNGAVWSWGYNLYGQLGNGTQGDRSFADRVPALGSGVVAIATGQYHSLAVRGSDGSVWAWGYNNSGQLGNNTTTQSLVPVPVLTQGASGNLIPLTGIVAVAAGNYHSLALRNDGSVWAWGYNSDGELGNGATANQSVAVQVLGPGATGTLGGVTAIAGGSYHSVALKSDGTVWTWGNGGSYQLGNGGSSSSSSPVQVKGAGGAGNLANIVAVAAGVNGYHTLALKNDGSVWAWGANGDGQLGINSEGSAHNTPVQVVGIGTPHSSPTTASLGYLSGVVAIAAGQNHSLAVLNDGRVCAWGYNGSGQLGTNTNGDTAGDSDYPEVVVSTSGNGTLSGATSVSAGGDHSVAVTASGTIYGWGTNTFGESGNSNEVSPQSSPAKVIGLSFAAQAARPTFAPTGGSYLTGQTVTVSCATPGATIYYTLDDSEPTSASPSIPSGGAVSVSATAILRAKAFVNGGEPSAIASAIYQIGYMHTAAGLYHTLALDPNGAVWSWGYNLYGQLGNGTQGDRSFADRVPALGSGVVMVAAGNYHSLALRNDGSVWAWGYNNSGQLGNNTTTQSLVPVPVLTQGTGGSLVPLSGVIAIAAGSNHSLALKSDGSVWAWGYNGDGELGNGATTNQSVAVPVLGPGATGTLGGIVAVAGGNSHSVALGGNGSVWAWGTNGSHQLGNGVNASYSYTPTEVSNVYDIVTIASGPGAYHTLAIRGDGTAWAWGANGDGQLGINSESVSPYYPVQVVGIGTPHSSPTTASLGYLSGVVSVAAGTDHSLAVLNNGQVCAWGYNSSGQLGTNTTGDTAGDSDYPEVAVSTSGSGTLTGIASVSAGGYHSVVVSVNGSIYGFGTDTYGEAGNGAEATSQPMPATTIGLNFAAQAARPTFAPEGGSYPAGQTVVLSCATPGSLIYYTLDGSVPTTGSSSVISGGTVTITGTAVLRAEAFVNGGEPSVVKSALYQIGFVRAAGGQYHTLALDNAGYVWSWGSDNYGQLGNNASGTMGGTPARVLGGSGTGYLNGVVMVAAGSNHSLALKSDGSVWAWGYNSSGQLGDGTTTQRLTPVQVQAQVSGANVPLSGVIAIAAGSNHSLALKSDGSVWAWGYNGDGELGNGATTNQSVAVPVLGPGATGTLGGIVAVAGGNSHSVALGGNGSVWAWGTNGSHQLGNGVNASYSYTPTEVSNVYDIVTIASGPGAYHTLAIRGDGTAWAWGANGDGQLGINSESVSPYYPVQVVGIGTPHSSPTTASLGYLSGVVSVAAGTDHSLAVLNNGQVCAWGYNSSGQLGTNTTGDTAGDSDYPEVAVSTSGSGTLTGIASVSAGGYHSVGVMAYQGVPIFFGWGDDSYGEVEGAAPASGPGQVAITTRPFPRLVHVDADADEDGLSDWQEYLHGSNPLNPDSNGDGILDGAAVAAGLDPMAPLPTLPPPDPNDHTPPQITITFPTVGITPL